MKNILLVIMAALCAVASHADTFTYRFNQILLSEALSHIAEQHPDIQINFIYNELDKYKTSVHINTDNAFQALRQTIGLNPVSVTMSNGRYYIEALQHGKFIYHGRAIGDDNEPVAAATVILLSPSDSTVITYGIADAQGCFSIPCDRRGVIAKLSCIGYKTICRHSDSFNLGEIIMPINAKQLQQVNVEGQLATVYSDRTVFIPTSRQKNAAIDAISLLSHMAIPLLDVTPGSMSVKTYTGQKVSVFIDYRAADEVEVQGLRTEDVLRVEVMQYPEDPRFQGQANVVNFIMRKYEWGGYTKLTGKGTTLNIDCGEGLLYSKFVNKNWTFDVSASGSLTHNNNYSSYNVEGIRDISLENNHLNEITRTSQCADYLKQNNMQSVAFRAIYKTKSNEIIHSVSYNRTATPIERQLSSVKYSDGVFSTLSALSKESGQTITPHLHGYYDFLLPKNNNLIISWALAYGSTRRKSSYQLGNQTPIINNNKETSYTPDVIIQYSKKFTHNNTLRTSLMTFNTVYHTDYAGSYNGLQKLLSSENMLFLEYMQNWKSGLKLYSRLGASYVIGRVNGVNTLEQWNPRLGLQLQYKINDRNSASIEGWWGNNHPTPASSNSAIVQSNELLWLQGNPDLRNTTFITASASYTFIPTNKFNMAATAEYHGYLNKTAYDYFTMQGYDGLIRKEINSGDYHSCSGYLSATLRLFDNSLSLKVSGEVSLVTTSGIDIQSINATMANLQANYYFKNFSFILYYQTPRKELGAFENGYRYHYKSNCGFIANYSIGDIKAEIQFRNCFNKNRYYTDFDSKRYSLHGWQWNGALARSIQLTLSYILPYGKKVHRNDEIQDGGTAGSAILK